LPQAKCCAPKNGSQSVREKKWSTKVDEINPRCEFHQPTGAKYLRRREILRQTPCAGAFVLK